MIDAWSLSPPATSVLLLLVAPRHDLHLGNQGPLVSPFYTGSAAAFYVVTTSAGRPGLRLRLAGRQRPLVTGSAEPHQGQEVRKTL